MSLWKKVTDSRPRKNAVKLTRLGCLANRQHRLRLEPLEDRRMLSVLRVDADALAGGDGLAWDSAYDDLQLALDQAEVLNADEIETNDIDQIWVAEGTYKPTERLLSEYAHAESFSLLDNVGLYGGFEGNETALEQRDWTVHETILSGDLGIQNITMDNADTVVYCGENIEATIDGIRITGGNAHSFYFNDIMRWYECNHIWGVFPSEKDCGGGIFNRGTLSVTNSTITANSAANQGGGIYNGGNLSITDSTIAGNQAFSSGGGICNSGIITVTNSNISKNTASFRGGGIHNHEVLLPGMNYICVIPRLSNRVFLLNSTVSENTAQFGGGLSNDLHGLLDITGSTIACNTASNNPHLSEIEDLGRNEIHADGGGIHNQGVLKLSSSVVSGNVAKSFFDSTEDGIHRSWGGGIFQDDGQLNITNSTISGNSASRGGGVAIESAPHLDPPDIITIPWDWSPLPSNIFQSSDNFQTGLSISAPNNTSIANSILSLNTATADPDFYGNALILEGRNNLIGIDPKFVRNPSDGGDGWGDDPGTIDIDESANDDYGDLRLRPGSPAINTGANELAVFANGTPLLTDRDGNPRILCGTVDIGAYESAFDRYLPSSVLCVDADAPAGGYGLVWETAFDDLQAALDKAELLNSDEDESNNIEQIWIAEGTYKPTELLEGEEARSASFSLLNNVALYGGFQGTETAIDQRDWTVHETILSGDLGIQDDASDNACTVVFCSKYVKSTIDGIKITGGNADLLNENYLIDSRNGHDFIYGVVPSGKDCGGGIFNRGLLSVANSIITACSVTNEGGGIYNKGKLTVTNSTICGNDAKSGGGISNDRDLTVTNSTISGNHAEGGGGGILSTYHLFINNSTISENSAMNGGGVLNKSYRIPWHIYPCVVDGAGGATITDSTISGNSANNGGGIYNGSQGSATVTNSTISGNSANNGGGIYNGGGFSAGWQGVINVASSTILGNSANNGGGIYNAGGLRTEDGSCVGFRGMATVTSSTIIENEADSCGGGFYNLGDLSLISSTLSENSAHQGGGIYNFHVSDTHHHLSDTDNLLVIANSVLVGNEAFEGGGIYCGVHHLLFLTNSTISGNSANCGGGIYTTESFKAPLFSPEPTWPSFNDPVDIVYNEPFRTILNDPIWIPHSSAPLLSDYGVLSGNELYPITNSIICLNDAETDPNCHIHAETDLSSNVELISGPAHNLIDIDPKFVRNPSDGGDGWRDNPDTPGIDESANNDLGDLRLRPDSPAINTGDNEGAVYWKRGNCGHHEKKPLETDRAGESRIQEGTVDIGAHESPYTLTESSSWNAGLIVRQWGDTSWTDSLGQASAIPESIDWIDEWTECWVEVWGTINHGGIGTFSVTLDYPETYFVPEMDLIEFGGGMVSTFMNVDPDNGTVSFSGITKTGGLGIDQPVLLGRVPMKPIPGESAMPDRPTDGYAQPIDIEFAFDQFTMSPFGDSAAITMTESAPATVELWPKLHDLNRDGQVDIEDIIRLISVYKNVPGESALDDDWAADFDRNGLVDIKDIIGMIGSYKVKKSDLGGRTDYSFDFPFQRQEPTNDSSGFWCTTTSRSDNSTEIMSLAVSMDADNQRREKDANEKENSTTAIDAVWNEYELG